MVLMFYIIMYSSCIVYVCLFKALTDFGMCYTKYVVFILSYFFIIIIIIIIML